VAVEPQKKRDGRRLGTKRKGGRLTKKKVVDLSQLFAKQDGLGRVAGQKGGEKTSFEGPQKFTQRRVLIPNTPRPGKKGRIPDERLADHRQGKNKRKTAEGRLGKERPGRGTEMSKRIHPTAPPQHAGKLRELVLRLMGARQLTALRGGKREKRGDIL